MMIKTILLSVAGICCLFAQVTAQRDFINYSISKITPGNGLSQNADVTRFERRKPGGNKKTRDEKSEYNLLSEFAIENGLPSNHVYDVMEDELGFLWVATDNGVSRFDGHYFQNYSTANGLPSNDVLQVIKESDGRIWANCFRHPPAYFDAENNRFVTISSDTLLSKMSATFMRVEVIPGGGIYFHNHLGSVIIINGKHVRQAPPHRMGQNLYIPDGKVIGVKSERYETPGHKKMRRWELLYQGQVKDSFHFPLPAWKASPLAKDNHLFLFSTGNQCVKITVLQANPLRYVTDTLNIPAPIVRFGANAGYIFLLCTNGWLYLYNLKKLEMKAAFAVGAGANCIYMDQRAQLWIGTLDRGVACYGKNAVTRLQVPGKLVNRAFLSLTADRRGNIAAGTFYGEILNGREKRLTSIKWPGHIRDKWIRRLFYMGSRLIAVSDEGYAVSPGRLISTPDPKEGVNGIKSAMPLNDSVFIAGSLSGLVSVNIYTGKYKKLNSPNERISSCIRGAENTMYFLSTGGLYKYITEKDEYMQISLSSYFQNQRITAVATAPNGMLWAAVSNGSLLMIKHDSIVQEIRPFTDSAHYVTCMAATDNSVWTGGKTGLTVTEYGTETFNKGIRVWHISKTDGLPSDGINELLSDTGYIYAATDRGIAKIPVDYRPVSSVINPALTKVFINGAEAPVQLYYRLRGTENSILLTFSGIDLTGHFKYFQYAVNDTTAWVQLQGNTLNLRLLPGHQHVYIRAADANNVFSSVPLSLHFYTPLALYKQKWVWALAGVVLTVLVFVVINSRVARRQRIAHRQQLALEEQRRRITADLHDEVGASLSSLQMNAEVASLLADRDIDQAKTVLQKIGTQTRGLAESIGDLVWSMKPGREALMSLDTRIKTFAVNLFGAGATRCHIHIDAAVEHAITDFLMRKNLVLIIKEALNNAAKYSGAAEIKVTLILHDGKALLDILDNGSGFTAGINTGNGLPNMRRRAEEMGGWLAVDSAPGRGTHIRAGMPVPETNDTTL